MSDELYYLDNDGKKHDAELHAEILREDDELFNLRITARVLNEIRADGNHEIFEMIKPQYERGLAKLGIESEIDLTPF